MYALSFPPYIAICNLFNLKIYQIYLYIDKQRSTSSLLMAVPDSIEPSDRGALAGGVGCDGEQHSLCKQTLSSTYVFPLLIKYSNQGHMHIQS